MLQVLLPTELSLLSYHTVYVNVFLSFIEHTLFTYNICMDINSNKKNHIQKKIFIFIFKNNDKFI